MGSSDPCPGSVEAARLVDDGCDRSLGCKYFTSFMALSTHSCLSVFDASTMQLTAHLYSHPWHTFAGIIMYDDQMANPARAPRFRCIRSKWGRQLNYSPVDTEVSTAALMHLDGPM
jgi:hypothetical protein